MVQFVFFKKKEKRGKREEDILKSWFYYTENLCVVG
jgi:hypothetical protein